MKRPLLVAIVCLAAAAAGAGGYLLWQSRSRAAAIAEGIPERPDLAGWPEEFRNRIETCTARIETGEDPLRALAELAQLYHANGFFSEASICYHALLRAEPKNPRWPHAFASILAGYGRIAEAATLWRRTVELAPGYLPARLRLGDVLLKDNRLDEASEVYASVLAIDARQPYAHLGVGRIHVARGAWDQARGPLEQAAALSGNRLAYDLLPTVYERLGNERRARELRGMSKASGAFADVPDPWLDDMMLLCYDTYRLAVAAGAAQHGGDRRVAMQLLERARALSPESAPIHFQLGNMYLATKEYTKARPHFEQCTRLAPDMADGWIRLSSLLALVGNRAESERVLAEGFKHCPSSPGLHLERARRAAEARDYEAAIRDYRESFRLRPDEAGPLLSIARIYFDLNRNAEGVAELQRALEAEPGYPPALSALTLHAIVSGDRAGARAWLRRLELQPRVTSEDREHLLATFREKFGEDP